MSATADDVFDWKRPDYAPTYRRRARILKTIRGDKTGRTLRAFKAHYRDHPADFINDWGMTLDPRNADLGNAVLTPFLLFPKQREWVDYVMRKWKAREHGLTEKSRDGGLSWLAMSLACTLCLFRKDLVIGFGSRKEEYVDKLGAPKSLFFKARAFLEYLPAEFLDGFDIAKHAPHMRIMFPGSNSVIAGEAGDGIGRGDRAALYFVDEAAWLERPELVDASLSAATNCRMDISSVHGMTNPFAIKRHSGKIEVFTFSWRDDPRKDQAWYEKQVADLDPIVVAQEIDISYNASAEGTIIPWNWIQACVDAHIKLRLPITGKRSASLDVADLGRDKNAFAVRHGILLEHVESWSGENSDLLKTTSKAFRLCDQHHVTEMNYDADGMGGSVRGKASELNEIRGARDTASKIRVSEYRGSASVTRPESIVPRTKRTNEDYFQNFKAQAWYMTRARMENTFQAVNGQKHDPDNLISISSKIPEITRLLSELAQPTWKESLSGKLVCEKMPDGALSPNLADAVVMVFNPRSRPMAISDEALRLA